MFELCQTLQDYAAFLSLWKVKNGGKNESPALHPGSGLLHLFHFLGSWWVWKNSLQTRKSLKKIIRRFCLTHILLSFQLGNQVIIFYPGHSIYLYIQVMTLTHAQVLALWVKLNPSKNSAGPVLDPKMDNNEQHCRSPWARHRQQTLLSPAQHKEPTLQSL